MVFIAGKPQFYGQISIISRATLIIIHVYLFSFNFAARENEILDKTSVGGKRIFSVCQMSKFKF